jgi:hypothetical protein
LSYGIRDAPCRYPVVFVGIYTLVFAIPDRYRHRFFEGAAMLADITVKNTKPAGKPCKLTDKKGLYLMPPQIFVASRTIRSQILAGRCFLRVRCCGTREDGRERGKGARMASGVSRQGNGIARPRWIARTRRIVCERR